MMFWIELGWGIPEQKHSSFSVALGRQEIFLGWQGVVDRGRSRAGRRDRYGCIVVCSTYKLK